MTKGRTTMNVSAAQRLSSEHRAMAGVVLPAVERAQQVPSLRGETLLMRELTHRVANDWTAAIATIRAAAYESDDAYVKAVLDDVASQLHRQAELMRALQIPNYEAPLDAAEYLGGICLCISRSRLDAMNVRLVFAADPLLIEANRCCRLGMIVCELVTNSARHAFHDRDRGRIRIELCRADSLAECRISDNGTAKPGTRPGHGLSIVQELVASLGGTIEHEFGPRGCTSILQFPM